MLCLQKLLWVVNIMNIQLWKFWSNTRRDKCLEMVGNWTLHHDNACSRVTTSVQQYLRKFNIKNMPYPPCSPDLAPFDFWQFLILKEKLHGKKCMTDSEVISAAQVFYSSFQKNSSLLDLKSRLNNGTVA